MIHDNEKLFISPSVVIESMRDNGYKNTAYALAELIDNSIQAEATDVYLAVFEKETAGRNQIDKIAIIDNGSGMSPELLHAALEFGASENRKDIKGMGKFGMGLPNSSISQCKHTTVYSWQDGQQPYFTVLDIDQIKHHKQEYIPIPIQTALPKEIASVFEGVIPASGTAVVWDNLDRLHWKTSTALLRNTEDIIGRMYRRMISTGSVRVIFKSYILPESTLFGADYEKVDDIPFIANDPLQLIKNTTLKKIKDYPVDLIDKPAFTLVDEKSIEVVLDNGNIGTVTIRSSIVSEDLLASLRKTTTSYVGSTTIGKSLKNNIGLSIMRAGRELDLIENYKLFDDKRRDRWIGVEIEFDPILDEFFGVTNNKQSANKIKPVEMSDADVLRRLGVDTKDEAVELLKDNNTTSEDTQLIKCLNFINSYFTCAFEKVKNLNLQGTGITDSSQNRVIDPINIRATERQEKSTEKLGYEQPPKPTRETVEESFNELAIKGTIASEQIPSLVDEAMNNDLRVKFVDTFLPHEQFFNVTSSEGFTIIEINTEHNFYKNFIAQSSDTEQELLKLSLAAWGQMEADTTLESRKDKFKMTRQNWGIYLSEYLAIEE
ncbi:ATP-binding protein [Psychrobacter sp. I-STPA10]|uniref:ATP-binding protein n=1 Tax=Psychrobacter sp. I-STPA10 TaxID=2585769 RepID=UPI001E3ADEE8|nr:ATP-binding protein [Psychrobacter sp. I-STPA10]